MAWPDDPESIWGGLDDPDQPAALLTSDLDLLSEHRRALMASLTPAGQSQERSSSPVEPGLFEPGSQFGVYAVRTCIGEGGMARVYQAEHAGLRRQVALKVLIDGFGRDPDGRERFVREARIAAAIKHPNVVNIFDVGVHENIPYLVMEFLEGQDLEKLLQSKGALEETLIVNIMVPVVAGLLAVHDAGIVHRDLKPGNIFLARGRHSGLEPKLLDFGISKANDAGQLKLTANRAFMGTPFYISPEALHGGEMTPLSDQYSLGVVMYECATGVAPFRASSLIELSNLIGSGQYTPVRAHKPKLSPRLERIIDRAMSLDPEDRFKDLREMGCELLQLAGQRTRITWGLSFGDPSAGDVSPPVSAVAEVPRGLGAQARIAPVSFARRKWTSIAAFGMAAVLLLLGSTLFFRTFAFSVRGRSDSAIVPATEQARAAGGSAALGGHGSVVADVHPFVATPPPAAKAPSSDPSDAHPAAAAPGSLEGADRVDPPDQSAVRSSPWPAAPTARPAKVGVGADSEWALPSGAEPSGPIRRGEIEVGANNAPILD
jgi:tRNA A-37 threonylcarbamoyl transferase component Bud32